VYGEIGINLSVVRRCLTSGSFFLLVTYLVNGAKFGSRCAVVTLRPTLVLEVQIIEFGIRKLSVGGDNVHGLVELIVRIQSCGSDRKSLEVLMDF